MSLLCIFKMLVAAQHDMLVRMYSFILFLFGNKKKNPKQEYFKSFKEFWFVSSSNPICGCSVRSSWKIEEQAFITFMTDPYLLL